MGVSPSSTSISIDWIPQTNSPPDELAALGFDDLLAGTTIAALEWGDKFPEALPPGVWRFVFSINGEARKIRRMP